MILFTLAASVLPETRETGKLSFTAKNSGERAVRWKSLSNLTRRRRRRRHRRSEAYGKLWRPAYKNFLFFRRLFVPSHKPGGNVLLNWKINSLFARDLPRVGRSDFNERDRLCGSSFPCLGGGVHKKIYNRGK